MTQLKFVLFLIIVFSRNMEQSEKTNIGLIVDENIADETIGFTVMKLEGYFNVKVHTIKNNRLPIEFEKDTINVIKLIDYAQKELMLSHCMNLFLTNKGIAGNDNAKYSLRGFSKSGSGIAVVSTLVVKKESETKEQYEYFFCKVLIHEMGHLFGLDHCNNNDQCIMVSSYPSPQRFYAAKNKFCDFCLEKIDRKQVNLKKIRMH